MNEVVTKITPAESLDPQEAQVTGALPSPTRAAMAAYLDAPMENNWEMVAGRMFRILAVQKPVEEMIAYLLAVKFRIEIMRSKVLLVRDPDTHIEARFVFDSIKTAYECAMKGGIL